MEFKCPFNHNIIVSEENKKKIRLMSGYGLRDEDIANICDISQASLRDHFSQELKIGRSRAFNKVAKTAFRMATSGKDTAMTIFWLKVRGKGQFKEIAYVEDPKTQDPIKLDLKKLSSEELIQYAELLRKASSSTSDRS